MSKRTEWVPRWRRFVPGEQQLPEHEYYVRLVGMKRGRLVGDLDDPETIPGLYVQIEGTTCVFYSPAHGWTLLFCEPADDDTRQEGWQCHHASRRKPSRNLTEGDQRHFDDCLRILVGAGPTP